MLKSPFPYFGSKRRAAQKIWEQFGSPKVFVEPCCGSAAVLLARPTKPEIEIINDADGCATSPPAPSPITTDTSNSPSVERVRTLGH
jgi:hypothetical protein